MRFYLTRFIPLISVLINCSAGILSSIKSRYCIAQLRCPYIVFSSLFFLFDFDDKFFKCFFYSINPNFCSTFAYIDM